MLEDLLSAVPDTLTVDEVAELTGYNRTTILHSIINYLATDKTFKNTQKSEWHMNTILLFMNKE